MSWGLDVVRVEFGDRVALDDVSISVGPGEIAVVVGGDGSGKSTLCRTMVGLETAASGRVSRPNRTGFQPESSGVWVELTVIENLEFVARGYGLESSHARERIEELLVATNLTDAADRLGRHLSGGMRQRLGVAMAVLSEPDLLVLDEPTTGLDPVSRLELWSFIHRSAREGRAIIVSTTYVSEASRGDTILTLDQGKVLSSGSLDEVLMAMPGKLFRSAGRVGSSSWRRGSTWRVWSPDGSPVSGAEEVTADLSDVVTVAALAEELR